MAAKRAASPKFDWYVMNGRAGPSRHVCFKAVALRQRRHGNCELVKAPILLLEETSMLQLRLCLIAALALAGTATLAQAQTTAASASAPKAATAPGVTRAVEHPDTTVDQTQPDSHQPETAADPRSSGPETAKDDSKGKPETASDVAPKSALQKAADQAKQGVRSNTPPPSKPQN
jgi:hypothetical protein